MQTDQQSVEPQQGEPPQIKPQQTQVLAPTLHARPHRLFFRGALLGLMGAALFAVGTIAVRTLHPVLPRLPNGSESVSARLAYYVQHKQWKADLHTLISAMEYVVQSDRLLNAVPPTNLPVAHVQAATPPNS